MTLDQIIPLAALAVAACGSFALYRKAQHDAGQVAQKVTDSLESLTRSMDKIDGEIGKHLGFEGAKLHVDSEWRAEQKQTLASFSTKLDKLYEEFLRNVRGGG